MKIKVVALNGTKEFEESFQDESLVMLDVVENQGLKLPFGCRSGSCGVCRVKIAGDLSCLEKKGFVEEDTLQRCHDPENIRLACQLRVAKNASGSLSLEIAPEAIIPDSE